MMRLLGLFTCKDLLSKIYRPQNVAVTLWLFWFVAFNAVSFPFKRLFYVSFFPQYYFLLRLQLSPFYLSYYFWGYNDAAGNFFLSFTKQGCYAFIFFSGVSPRAFPLMVLLAFSFVTIDTYLSYALSSTTTPTTASTIIVATT